MRIKRKHFRTLSGAIAFVMFFLVLGTVGAMECDTVPLTVGMIRAVVFMALWVSFTYLAGGFEEYTERRSSHEVQAEDAFAGPGRPGRQGPHSYGEEHITIEAIEKDRYAITTKRNGPAEKN